MNIEQENKKTLKAILVLSTICTFALVGLLSLNIISRTNKTMQQNDFNTEIAEKSVTLEAIKVDYEFIKKYVYDYTKINTEKIEEDFYRERIPAEYAEAFLYYTKNCKNNRIYFYSIMVHESCNFTVFKHKNRDGSIDKGPSQLNSKNLENEYFRELYCPKDESYITTRYCYYMVMTINLYDHLVSKYGYEYAFYAYNGGDKAVPIIKNNTINKRNKTFVSNIKAYNESVMYNVNRFSQELNNYIEEKSYEYRNNLINAYMVKLDKIKSNPTITNDTNYDVLIKYICDFGNKNVIYIRKEETLNLACKEIFVFAYDSLIGGFYVNS